MRYLKPGCLLMSFVVFCAPSRAQEQVTPASASKPYRDELGTLAADPAIKRAMAHIVALEPQTRKDHILLTQIPAPPFKEQPRARKFIDMMREAGADSVWTDREGNVFALRKGTSGKRTVVLEGHLDTVFPEGTDVTVKLSGDTLKAPGIGDDTRGLVVVLGVIKAMKEASIRTQANVIFGGTVGEEGLGDARGVKFLFKNGPKVDSYISVDGGGINSLTAGAVGSLRYRLTVKGPGGHSFGAFGLANPHHAMARIVHYFISEADPYTRSGIKTTYNVGVVGGGTSVNAIPSESWVEIDMRSESPTRLEGIDRLLKAAITKGLAEENAAKRGGPVLATELKLVGNRPSGMQSQDLPLVQRALASAELLGEKPLIGSSSTNSNIPISLGVPAVTIGKGGRGGNTHAAGEWWINDKGYLGIQNALLILVAEAGLAK